jgi:hypothetical protein
MAEKRTIVERVENAVLYSDGCIRVDNVRLSYPHLDKPWAKEGDVNDDGSPKIPKYSLKGLAPKETHEAMMRMQVRIINEMCADLKYGKLGADRKYIRNGDDLSGEENEGNWVISISENANKPPVLRSASNKKVEREDASEVFYPGCYVDIFFRPWGQDNKYGKRINANLIAVKFRADGERFGEGPIDDEGVFDENATEERDEFLDDDL